LAAERPDFARARNPTLEFQNTLALPKRSGAIVDRHHSQSLEHLPLRNFLIIVASLLGVMVVGLVVAGPSALKALPSFGSSNDVLEVRIATIARRPLVETVSAPGELDPEVKVDVSAEVSARILELPFREGATVRKGEVVVKLDDRDLKASLDAQMAQRDAERFRLRSEQERLASPNSQLANARANLERQESLFKTGDVSRADLDNAIARVRDLEAQIASAKEGLSVIESALAAAEANIERARELLKKTTISSPIDGQITELNAEQGELVVVGTMNNAGTKILTVADLGSVRLKAKVAESDIARVRAGQPAVVRVNAYRHREFKGAVERVALARGTEQSFGSSSGASGSGQGGWFKCEVKLDLAPGETLLSGLAANVDIEVDRKEGLLVPSQAILEKKLDDLPVVIGTNPLVDPVRKTAVVVFKIVDGKAVVVPLRTGASNLSDTLVLEGLSEGDAVVTGPYRVLERLKQGDAVREEAPKDAAKQGSGAPASASAGTGAAARHG
jgi:HlyD family secretion protein